MAYLLNGTTIRNPKSFEEANSTQVAENRTLDGTVSRDYFGSNKKVWTLNFENAKKTDYDTINTIYQSYLSTGATQSFQVTETNYAVAATNVHIDLFVRSFSIQGNDYLSNFTLILKED